MPPIAIASRRPSRGIPTFTFSFAMRPVWHWPRRISTAPATSHPTPLSGIGALPRPVEADCRILMLLRSDAERAARDDEALRDLPNAVALDWLEEDAVIATDPTERARLRVERGLRLLSRGERIVTDRLHGHILALLLGIPMSSSTMTMARSRPITPPDRRLAAGPSGRHGGGRHGRADGMIDISLMICTRNRRDSLSATLDSVAAAAGGQRLELIIVDNGSTDDSAATIRHWAADRPFTVRLLSEPRPGLARARNVALAAARGASSR